MPQVQLFAFEIATHSEEKINAILRQNGVDPDEMTPLQYFHQQANLQRDLIVRHVVPAIQGDVLPVFLAPEFFFKWRDGLPYDRATFFNAIEYLKTLSAAFPEVLWIIGTVWWSEPHAPGVVMVHNSALILQGGRVLHSWQKDICQASTACGKAPSVGTATTPPRRMFWSTARPRFSTRGCPMAARTFIAGSRSVWITGRWPGRRHRSACCASTTSRPSRTRRRVWAWTCIS